MLYLSGNAISTVAMVSFSLSFSGQSCLESNSELDTLALGANTSKASCQVDTKPSFQATDSTAAASSQNGRLR